MLDWIAYYNVHFPIWKCINDFFFNKNKSSKEQKLKCKNCLIITEKVVFTLGVIVDPLH